MTELAISLLETHASQLRQHLLLDGVNEHSAYVFFGVADIGDVQQLNHRHLLVSHSVEHVPASMVLESSPWGITWLTTDVVQKLKMATSKRLTLGIAHNHTTDTSRFSSTDDANERELIRMIQNRNGPDAHLASLLFTPNGQWDARLWTSPENCIGANEFRTIGTRFEFRFSTLSDTELPTFLDRQVLALGRKFSMQLKRLRVVVVGCGGTGSAISTLLARMGVGSITLIDKDSIEESNLNRLHGAQRSDAVMARAKVEAVARSIREADLGTEVTCFKEWVSSPVCRDALKDAHLVFGCTDDHYGRIVLNRFAYAYQIPVVDMGLAIEISKGDPPVVQAMDGRVTVLLPGSACLLCRGVIDPRRAADESLKRDHPKEYEQRKAEAYVLGEGDPSPAVVTFTTELACMAVNEVVHRIQGYRGEGGATENRMRLFHRMMDLRPSCEPSPECRVCGQPLNWCLGDTEPFLGIVA